MRLHRSHTWQLVVMLAAAALGVPACGDDDQGVGVPADSGPGFDSGPIPGGSDAGPGGSGGVGPSDAGPQDANAGDAGMLSDDEIVAVMTAANDGEIQEAELARSTSSDGLVTGFANRMVADHSAANQMLVSTSVSSSLSPIENPLSNRLRVESSKQQKKLMALSGTEFDQAYMQAQVKDHRQVLALIDDILLPQVRNTMLKALLRSMRKTVAMHLSMARDIVDQLEADGGAEDGGM
jgi:putative membrane protein